MKKIVICGGHLTPAIALIAELKNNKRVQLLFFGRKFSMEGSKSRSAEYIQITKEKNVKFYTVTAGRLPRKFTKYTVISLLKIPIGFFQSFIYLLKERPSIIVSFGGYLSLPVVFSGWLLGIKSIIHEQSATAGLANKINSLFAEKIFLTFSQSIRFFPEDKSQVIGNLTRKSIFVKKAKDPKIEKFLEKSQKLILIMGGNQGSHFLNNLIFKLLPHLSKFHIFHQVGTANYQGELDKSKKIKQENYLSIDYIDSENIGAVLNKADLIICRSGANTVWDIATLSKNAIFVPLPISAGNEQQFNAQILKDAGSCQILDQKDANEETLHKEINDFFANIKNYQKKGSIFQKNLTVDAAPKIVNYISR